MRPHPFLRSTILPLLALGLLAPPLSAEDHPDLADAKQKISYALGMDIVAALKRDDVEINLPMIAAGLADQRAGKSALSPEQQKAAMRTMQSDIAARAEARKKIAAVANLKTGADFLAANAKKDGVTVVPTTTSDGAPAEVQYQILATGAGPAHRPGDTLKLHYEGRLLDGTVFDSSLRRSEPFVGRANDFIAGWTEPLQRMKVGDKWRLFVPPSLGYGEFVPYDIGPNSTLIYDIELLGIEKSSDTPSAPSDAVPPEPVKPTPAE
jgi:FKBP-type peptidyl-prolyl cis-trans isomerase